MKQEFKAKVVRCARCGKDHKSVRFYPLDNHEKYTHFGNCSRTGQPILMIVKEDEKTDETKS